MKQNDVVISPDLLRNQFRARLAYLEFWEFCKFYDEEFFSQRRFLKDIANAFQEIEEGKLKSLAVSMPPRAGKSYITSLFCAWTLGRNPEESVMRNTCTATLYVKFSYDVRAIVKSLEFQQVFPNVKLSDDKKNLGGWNTNQSKQVGYFGSGVGGTIIGFGATKIAVTDDLYRGLEDAMSSTMNDKIIQWKEATHDSRFESGCARIDIGTRWSLLDVIGKNIESDTYEKIINVPALNSENETFCEAVMTTEEYLSKKQRTAPEIWSAEYMQEPVDIGGRLFNDISYIEPDRFQKIYADVEVQGALAYIDVADQGKDYTAMAVALLISGQVYLAEVIYTRDNTDVTIPLCSEVLKKWGVSYCRVESNSMGAMFARHLQKTTNTKILQVHNTTNKETRILMNSAWLQNMVTFVKNDDRDTQLFMQSVLTYSRDGKNKNDDAPDCLAGLSIFCQSMFRSGLS